MNKQSQYGKIRSVAPVLREIVDDDHGGALALSSREMRVLAGLGVVRVDRERARTLLCVYNEAERLRQGNTDEEEIARMCDEQVRRVYMATVRQDRALADGNANN